VLIDRTVFKKTPEDKQRLKTEKARLKNGYVQKKHISPSKQKRGDLYFTKKREMLTSNKPV